MRVLFYISVELSLGSGREELKTEDMGKTLKKVYLFIFFCKGEQRNGGKAHRGSKIKRRKKFFCTSGKIGNSSRFV